MSPAALKETGASLTEVVLAMGIIGLAATLGIEGLGGIVARSEGRAAATALAGELRAARLHATMRRELVRVAIDVQHSTVRTEPADAPGQAIRELSIQERGVRIEDSSAGSSIIFYPSGRVATPTTITLRNRRSERWRLTVTMTGRVTIQ